MSSGTSLVGTSQVFQSGVRPTDTRYPTAATVECSEGATWSDGQTSQTVSCQATGQWSSFTASCTIQGIQFTQLRALACFNTWFRKIMLCFDQKKANNNAALNDLSVKTCPNPSSMLKEIIGK